MYSKHRPIPEINIVYVGGVGGGWVRKNKNTEKPFQFEYFTTLES